MAKPTFTFENYAPAGNTLYDLYRYYLDPSAYDDDEEEVLNPGLAPFFGIGAQTIGGQGQDDTSNIWNYAAQQVVEEARREHLLRNSLVPTSIGAMTGADAGWQVTEDAIIAQQMKDAWSEGHDDARRAAQEKAEFDRVVAENKAKRDAEAAAQRAYATSSHPYHGGNQDGRSGESDGRQAAADRAGGSSYSSPFKYGGPVYVYKRKKYGNGGIIGLL